MTSEQKERTPLNEALKKLTVALCEQGFAAGTETVSVTESAGRITAVPVRAVLNVPHYDASAMDGITTRAELVRSASDSHPVTLSADQYTVVDTGDPVTETHDTVVMKEYTLPGDGGTIQVTRAVPQGKNIRPTGEDIKAGEELLEAYVRITPAAVGAMIAGGVNEVSVLKRPVIGFIPTGDEIIPPGRAPAPGEITDFNSSVFAAMLREWQADVRLYPITPDKKDLLQTALAKALDECDFVLLGAGSSTGRDDYTVEIIAQTGTVLAHGLAVKPGRPTIVGYKDAKPLIGIPGYPVAGVIILREVVKPVIDLWYHGWAEPRCYCDVALAEGIKSKPHLEEFARVHFAEEDADPPLAVPHQRGSGSISEYMRSDGILRIPVGCDGYAAGDVVTIELLD